MNTLSKILEHKKQQVAQRKKECPIRDLTESQFYRDTCRSFSEAIRHGNPGIIAEIKRKSPSQGAINANLDAVALAKIYQTSGAAAISVLTDEHFFGGTSNDLSNVKSNVSIPVLRKDFIVDEYQVFEAKSIGADAILLIAEALEKSHLHELALIASSLGMEVLLEIHTADQLEKFNEEIHVLGVNNRNLKTQEISLKTSVELYPFLPKGITLITESGVQTPTDLISLVDIGYHGALIGTSIVGNCDPGSKLKQFTHLKTNVSC
jgi:indole-3-glycerol phosphate synthase